MDNPGRSAIYERLIGPAALLVIVVLVHWKLTLTHQYTWLENYDIANLVLPWFQFQATEWHHHHFPLWDPNSWFGQPLFGQGQPGSAYPLNWLMFLAPLKNGLLRESVLNWYYVGVRYLAALAAYALARDLGRSRIASILAGCVYGLGGYVANTPAPQMVNGAVWTPLVFLFLFRAERGVRPWASALLSGFFLGFGWLAGHHQMNLYVSIAAGGLWIWLCVRERKLDWGMLRLAAGSLTIAALTSGFQTVPMAEYGRLAVRWSGPPEPLHFNETVPYTVLEQYSLKPLGLLGVFIPGLAKGANPFVGVVALTLAVLGAILGWKERQVRWLTVMSLGGIVFSLGPNSLLHGVLYSLVPLIEKARAPGAGTVMFALGIAPLVAYGLDLLPMPASLRWSKRATWVLAGWGAFLAALSLFLYAAKIESALGDNRILITALASVLAAGLFAAWRSGAMTGRLGAIAAVGLVLFELANVTDYALPNRTDPAATPVRGALNLHSDLADYIRSHDAAARIQYDDGLIQYNIGDWYGIEALNAYTAGALTKIYEMDVFSRRSMDFFGIRYYLGKTPVHPDLNAVFTGTSGLTVFENPTAYPRAWSVHAATSLRNRSELLRTFHDPNFDPRITALVSEPAPAEIGNCGANGDQVSMPMHQSSYVRIEATMACRGIVVLADSSFPGWGAYVDGKRVPILETYGSVRGVVVEAGDHTIEFRYRPWSVLLGGLMTAFAAGVVILTNWRARKPTLASQAVRVRR